MRMLAVCLIASFMSVTSLSAAHARWQEGAAPARVQMSRAPAAVQLALAGAYRKSEKANNSNTNQHAGPKR